jgi:hypothetical protein
MLRDVPPTELIGAPLPSRRCRVLVLCAHLRRDRTKRRSRDLLQPIGGLHIASLIDEERYEVSLYHEDWHGPYDTRALTHFDLVFLSGLQPDFDRMRQLSYHFRRAGATVVAGGNICSIFPAFAARFFDVVCVGGVDSVKDLLRDFERGRLRPIYRSPQERITRYKVDYALLRRAGINLPAHLIESSRGCSFRCNFCVIPAEGVRHVTYALAAVSEAIDAAILASPWYSLSRLYPFFWFVDNNLSDNREHLLQLCDFLSRHKKVRAWGGLVTQNILRDRALMRQLAASKCIALFAGVESLDPAFLRRQNKKQNLANRASVVDDILFAERLGICVSYAYLFDPRYATVAEMQRQIDALVQTDGLPMPTFFSIILPLAGTESFWESARARELRPNLRMRDLDGETVAFSRLADTESRLTEFIRILSGRPGHLIDRRRLLWTTLCRFRNSGRWNPFLWYLIYASNFRPFFVANSYFGAEQRRYLGGLDALDPQYAEHPPGISAADKVRYFEPIRLTDEHGELADWLAPYAASIGRGVRDAVAEGTEQPLTIADMD